jgi:hypothetical protein
MSYREENGEVVLTLSRDDYDLLLILLGLAVAALLPDPTPVDRAIRMINRLNEGNPQFAPYQVKPS